MYYAALAALRDMIKECLGDIACDYATFVSLGEPPAQCDSISVFMDSVSRDDTSSSTCQLITDDAFTVTMTKCCAEREEFDPTQEDLDAQCFLEDLYALKTCLDCNIADTLSEFTHDCGPDITRIEFDGEKQGGCYSASIHISMSEFNCCPDPVIPPDPGP